MRSNSALLEKVNPNPSEKERIIRDRIQRASLTMKSMSETLLWLSREEDSGVPIDNVHLGTLINNTQSEMAYLLVGKTVSVNIDVDETEFALATIPAVIVLNNLIRNAFQHTQHGKVEIKQREDTVVITNIEFDQSEMNDTNEDLGFGLGMQLVEKLTNRFGWHYSINHDGEGYQVSISFLS
jgi:signal transduction histidine kinase